ncbi:MAG TPA: MFS transporter [Aestuariivirga sp.]
MSHTLGPRNTTAALWALVFGNFLIGTGILLPSGLLNEIAKEFTIDPDVAGRLVLVGGIVVALGAPIFATWTSRMDRRSLLAVSLLLYAVGHLAAALTPSFELQLIIRAFTVVAAAIFTPQAAATVGLIVPPEKRAATISFIFIGWSAAAAGGIPLANYMATMMDWRAIYILMAALCVIGAAAVWLTLPSGLHVQRQGLEAWIKAFASPVLLLIYCVTALSMAGQFTMLTYIAPIMRDGFGVQQIYISIVLAIVGVSGILGNSLATRFVQRVGTDNVIAMGLAALAIGFFGFGIFFGHYWPAMGAAAFWGLGSFSSNSLQQSRLATLAPSIASVAIALNTSFVYVGQSSGAAVGGALLRMQSMPLMPWMAMCLMIVALALSLFATKLSPTPARP